MYYGATVKIIPSWVPETTAIDIQWDPNALSAAEPRGNWWGQLTRFVGMGSDEGEWRWEAAGQKLALWVWVPNPRRAHLLAGLRQFTFPVTTGMTGDGHLVPWLAPTRAALTFSWVGYPGVQKKGN